MCRWYQQSVFYHIYPLGLCGAPKDNTSLETVHRFNELISWIPYIKELGCSAVYIGPLFESSTHGYDTKDYRSVDRRLGDNGDFRQFVSLCHQSGIRVVVDGVFNHTGRGFFAFRDIQEHKWDSGYKDWYRGIRFDCASPMGDPFTYEAWQGHYVLPVLNLKNPEVVRYLLDTVSYWIREFDIDGIRLDCANVLDFDFMKSLRLHCDSVREDFWLMGEVIHGIYSNWANPQMLHSVTNYELHKGLYSGHNDYNCFEIAHTIRRQVNETSRGLDLYTFLDNHDEDRIMSKLKNRHHIYTAYTMLFTLPGIPSVYYGSEWGMEGMRSRTSDDSLRPALTSGQAQKSRSELTDYIRKLAAIHREETAFHGGDYRELLLTNRQYAYERIRNDSRVVTAVNIDDAPADIFVPLSGEAQPVDLLTGQTVPVENGKLKLHMEPYQSFIIKL